MRRKIKGYKPPPQVPVEPHALDRARERWPEAAYLYDSELQFLLSEQVTYSLSRDDCIIAPGGVYVPISILGVDGYAILLGGKVKTVMPATWCREVDRVRSKL